MKYIAAIDQGTTSTRCIVFDKTGKIISFAQKEHHQIYPSPGWVEHNPVEIWENSYTTLLESVSKTKEGFKQISAIGITNQRETIVLWDPITGVPYYNAIVWQDTRTDKLCAQYFRDGYGDLIKKKTGLPIATYFSGMKIKWLLENIPELKIAFQKNRLLFGNIDTWLIWNLTGGKDGGIHMTDVSNASRTMLMNLETLTWDHEILNLLDIPEEILPEIHPSSQKYGEFKINEHVVPIAGDLGDQQAALFGQLCLSKGDIKNTYGTGCFLLMNTGTDIIQSSNGLLTTVGYQIEGQKPNFCLEGSVAIAGALVQWLRDNLNIISSSKEIEKLAASVQDNGGLYFVPAFSGLFAPYWHAKARGLLIGLSSHSTKAHIARSALEATAFQTKEVIDAMICDSKQSISILKVDGGMVQNDLLMQFQADLLGIEILRPKVTETTALGAAYAAGLACGVWEGVDDLSDNWHKDTSWTPEMKEEKRKRIYLKWKDAVQRSMNWLN